MYICLSIFLYLFVFFSGREWSTLECDKYVETQNFSNILQTGIVPKGVSDMDASLIQSKPGANSVDHKELEDHLLTKLEKDRRQRVKGDTAGLPQIPQENIGNYLYFYLFYI